MLTLSDATNIEQLSLAIPVNMFNEYQPRGRKAAARKQRHSVIPKTHNI